MTQMTAIQQAIQQAINNANDPNVKQELLRFQQTGIPPTSQAAQSALAISYMANGLPAPAAPPAVPTAGSPFAIPRGPVGAVDSGYGTGNVSVAPDTMYAKAGAGTGAGTGTNATGAAATSTGGDNTDPYAAAAAGAQGNKAAGGDNTDPYAPAAAGAQGNNPAGTTAAAPAPGGTTAAAPTPGGTHVNPDPAAGAPTATNGHLDPSLFYGKNNPEGQISLFNQMLLKLGVDPTNPGLFGGAIMKRLMPIFDNAQTVGGLGAGKTWAADPLGGMNELANVLQTKGVSGLQDMGNAVLGNLHNLVGDNRDPAQQMAIQNAALGLSAEAMNPYMQQGMLQQSTNARTLYSLANSVGPDGKMTGLPTNYLDYLNSRNDNGAYKGLLDLLNGTGR